MKRLITAIVGQCQTVCFRSAEAYDTLLMTNDQRFRFGLVLLGDTNMGAPTANRATIHQALLGNVGRTAAMRAFNREWAAFQASLGFQPILSVGPSRSPLSCHQTIVQIPTIVLSDGAMFGPSTITSDLVAKATALAKKFRRTSGEEADLAKLADFFRVFNGTGIPVNPQTYLPDALMCQPR